jgi:hypothetical protein
LPYLIFYSRKIKKEFLFPTNSDLYNLSIERGKPKKEFLLTNSDLYNLQERISMELFLFWTVSMEF